MIVDTWTLTIERDDDRGDGLDRTAAFAAADAVKEAEENITDLLPDGYRAVITHWTGSEER